MKEARSLRRASRSFSYVFEDGSNIMFLLLKTFDLVVTTNHLPVFDPQHDARPDQHSYTLYWSDLRKNVPAVSV